MSALDELSVPPTSDMIALVRAQLQPIRSRRALLDLYRRESLCRMTIPALSSGSAVEVLEMAYALRWLELENDGTLQELEQALSV